MVIIMVSQLFCVLAKVFHCFSTFLDDFDEKRKCFLTFSRIYWKSTRIFIKIAHFVSISMKNVSVFNDFLVKHQENKWFRTFLEPKSKKTTWISMVFLPRAIKHKENQCFRTQMLQNTRKINVFEPNGNKTQGKSMCSNPKATKQKENLCFRTQRL